MRRNTQTLAAVGPVSPEHGFPLWYKDAAGVRLALAVDRSDPRTPAMGEPPVDPVAGFPPDFPDESFYFLADSRIPIGGGQRRGRARLVLALEAAFGGSGEVAPGQQMVFARIRIRIDGGAPNGSYVVRHPYGETGEGGELTADDGGRVFVTQDLGTVPLDFAAALAGEVAPFLRWTSGADLAPGEQEADPGYLGDGVTEHTVTGSPFGWNEFRIDGPGVGLLGPQFRDPADPTNTDRVLSRLFTVQGRLSQVAGVDVARAGYSRDAAGQVLVDVFAGSDVGQTLEVRGPAAAPTPLRAAGSAYVARLGTGTVRPSSVEVVNTGDRPQTVVTAAVVDQVVVTRAEHEPLTGRFVVEAGSSDAQDVPVLTVAGFGPMTGGVLDTTVAAPPVRVVVSSAHGGSGDRVVTLVGGALPVGPVPVPDADAGPDQAAVPGEQVVLDGSASTGATGFGWVQTAGPGIGVLADPGTATPSFTMPDADTVTVRLTVSGPGGPDSSDDVRVVRATDTLTVTSAQFRTGSQQWRVSGTATGLAPDRVTVVANPDDAARRVVLGTALVGPDGGWDLRRARTQAEPVPQPGEPVQATSSRGGSATVTLTVRN